MAAGAKLHCIPYCLTFYFIVSHTISSSPPTISSSSTSTLPSGSMIHISRSYIYTSRCVLRSTSLYLLLSQVHLLPSQVQPHPPQVDPEDCRTAGQELQGRPVAAAAVLFIVSLTISRSYIYTLPGVLGSEWRQTDFVRWTADPTSYLSIWFLHLSLIHI